MSWSLVMWIILAGGPVLGIAAMMMLAVYHEHGAQTRLARREPRIARRSSTLLLEDYLAEERTATVTERRHRGERLLLQSVRASTEVFEEFLADRAAQGIPAPKPVVRPVRVAARPPVLAPVPVFQRAARPTRLLPLSPEIALG